MKIDLAVVEQALDSVATSDRGRAGLDQLTSALDDFRRQIGVEMNDAEFRFVMERLTAQRVLASGAPEVAEVSGFAFDSFAQFAYPMPGSQPPPMKSAAFNQVLPGGWNIRAVADAPPAYF